MLKVVRYRQKGILSLSHPKGKKNKLKAIFPQADLTVYYVNKPFITSISLSLH